MRGISALAVTCLLAAAAPASGATRHVVPTGGATTGNCSATPCELGYANGVATTGDVVLLASGTYDRGAQVLVTKPGVTYQGAGPGTARPLLTGTADLFDDGPGGAVDVVVRDLRLVTSGHAFDVDNNAGGLVLERVTMRTTQGSYPMNLDCTSGAMLIRDSEFIAPEHGPTVLVRGTCSLHIRNSLFETGSVDLLIQVGLSAIDPQDGNLTLTIRNTIFDRWPDLFVNPPGSSASATISYSRVDDMPSGFVDDGGNITAQPAFADLSGFDFHQTEASPTRNAGSMDLHTASVDIDGEPRPQSLAPDIGPDEHPTLPPAVTTDDAADVTASSATLRGTVDPNGLATSSWFAFGIAEPLSTMTPARPAGSGTAPSGVTAPVTDLPAGTTVSYRLIAENGDGRTTGPIRSFTTTQEPGQAPEPIPPPIPVPECANGRDDDGDSFVDAKDPQCAAGLGKEAPRDNPILVCTGRPLTLTDVLPSGRRVRLAGLANPALAGRSVRFFAGSRAVARSTVRADGSFASTAAAPANRRVRFSARINTLRSAAFKFDRRTIRATVKASGASVVLSARVTAKRRAGAKVELLLRRGCDAYARVAQARLPKNGRLRIRTPTGTAAGAVVLRARITLRGGGRTYTLPRVAVVP